MNALLGFVLCSLAGGTLLRLSGVVGREWVGETGAALLMAGAISVVTAVASSLAHIA